MSFGMNNLFIDSVSAVTATAPDGYVLGMDRWENTGLTGVRKYRFLYNAGTSQVSVGYGVSLVTASTGYSVTVTSLTHVNYCRGVCYNATATTATYFWGVVEGFVPLVAHADRALTAGALFTQSVDGTFGDMPASQAAGTAATIYPTIPLGISQATTGSAGTGYGFIKVL